MRVEIRLCSLLPLKAKECHDECLASDYLVLHHACFTVAPLTNWPSDSGKCSFRSCPDNTAIFSGGTLRDVHTWEKADGYVELDVHDC